MTTPWRPISAANREVRPGLANRAMRDWEIRRLRSVQEFAYTRPACECIPSLPSNFFVFEGLSTLKLAFKLQISGC